MIYRLKCQIKENNQYNKMMLLPDIVDYIDIVILGGVVAAR